ncbi:MAG TPA: NAD(P)/FAD-dependent oxidoreductase [Gaiellaceae bacterium]|nr:NAD(P)/FAD-dependent oxidoreductase [Gaiellaceae bacterium]
MTRTPVAVVGGGSAGLAVAAMLRREGVAALVIESGDDVGTSWATRYDRLQLHTHRRLSGLPGQPMPRSLGAWPSRDGVRAYLHAYARAQGLDVLTGTTVERIDRDGAGWALSAGSRTITAGRVVVATGLNAQPVLPEWPGRESFPGPVVHSADYRNPEPYRGRDALVVGAGNSGAEIAVDLAAGGAARVRLAVRTPPHVVRRDTAGVPSQALGIVLSRLPAWVVDPVAAGLRRVSLPDLSAQGLPPQPRPYSRFLERRKIPIVDVGIVAAVRRGTVEVVPALERFDGDEVVLADGSRFRVDAVVAATGFRPGLEPLVGHLGVLDAAGLPLARGAQEDPLAPGLHFVGFTVTFGGALRQVGHEAKAIARHVAAAQRAPAAAPAPTPA